jgi:ribosomal protein L14
MLKKESILFITDNTNVRWVKIFHLYKGFFRKTTRENFFIKSSARIVEPPRIEYKGFRYKYKIKGDIIRVWICRVKKSNFASDKRCTKFSDNAGLCISKKNQIVSKYINGPAPRAIKSRKLVSLFKIV